jgi:hypothetical protein
MSDIFASLDALLDLLVVSAKYGTEGDARATLYREFAFDRASALLRADEDERMRRTFELRLRLAMHLAPQAAIAYQRSNPKPRWRLIREHLVNTFSRDANETERIARDIALVLDNWEAERTDVGHHRDYLMRRDGSRCSVCHVEFLGGTPKSLVASDDYKPYYTSPDELMTPEVDHIDAISALGTNILDNLQLLCRLCNRGKADGLGIDTRSEAQYAGTKIVEVPVAHRARMLYYVIERDGRRCSQCEASNEELTIRPLVKTGGYVRSNLQAICVTCAFAGSLAST